MRRQRKTDNNIINYNIFENIGTNALKSNLGVREHNNTPTTQKAVVGPHREPQTHTTSKTTINYAYNIKALQDTNTKIIKGLEAGQDTAQLLLIAIQGIDLLTGTNALYEQTRGIYSTIYTDVLQNKQTAIIEREDAIKRLEALEQATPTGVEEQARIKRAIAEHKKEIERYNDIINKL